MPHDFYKSVIALRWRFVRNLYALFSCFQWWKTNFSPLGFLVILICDLYISVMTNICWRVFETREIWPMRVAWGAPRQGQLHPVFRTIYKEVRLPESVTAVWREQSYLSPEGRNLKKMSFFFCLFGCRPFFERVAHRGLLKRCSFALALLK